MNRIIVGTAGHIDHGKTRLIQALTGTDCDRWAEEKRRGITIDLGFAHLEVDGLQMGFVDVPGHERFLDNALAGLGGIRVVLLVVAADEGVKPQTREHLAICQLLEIPAAIVALTKSDLVDAETLELAKMETAEFLEDTSFAGSQIIPVSSLTGSGIPELESRLVALATEKARDADPDRPVRLPVDRAFALKGLGQVVTGTLAAGTIETGDTLIAMPGGRQARVRSIQVHGQDRERAVEGERTAVRLGGIDSDDLARGTQLMSPGSYGESRRLLANFTLLADAPASIERPTPVRVHLATTEIIGRLFPIGPDPIEKGARAPVELRLARPVAVARGDRFIVRRPSPPVTLGGGSLLDPTWSRPRGRRVSKAIQSVSDSDGEAARFWVASSGAAGLSTSSLARRFGFHRRRVQDLLEELHRERKILKVPVAAGGDDVWLAPETFDRILQRAKRVLEEHFGRDRLAESMSKAEAVERILPKGAVEIADIYLKWLAAEKVLVETNGRVTIPGRKADMSREESQLSRAILAAFDQGAFAPPSPSELKQSLRAKPQVIDGVVTYLRQSGKLAQLPGGLLIATSVIDRIRTELTGSGEREFSVGDFKGRFGLSRKWAIPLLEHLDSIGFTRRIGNRRQIVAPRKE